MEKSEAIIKKLLQIKLKRKEALYIDNLSDFKYVLNLSAYDGGIEYRVNINMPVHRINAVLCNIVTVQLVYI